MSTIFGNSPIVLVKGKKIWDILREENPGFSCANLFWWYNMHSSVDYAITPRPLYRADGLKTFDIHTQPMNLREEDQGGLGRISISWILGTACRD